MVVTCARAWHGRGPAPAAVRMAKVVGWVEMLAADQRGAPGRRRLAAFGVDYAFIAAYLGVLVLLGVLGRAAGLLTS